MQLWFQGHDASFYCAAAEPSEIHVMRFFRTENSVRGAEDGTNGHVPIRTTCSWCRDILYVCMCTHKYTQLSECFQEVWMPGIPFELACSHGCSWMCACFPEVNTPRSLNGNPDCDITRLSSSTNRRSRSQICLLLVRAALVMRVICSRPW